MPGPFSLTIQPRKQKALGTRLHSFISDSQQPFALVFDFSASFISYSQQPFALRYSTFPLCSGDNLNWNSCIYTVCRE
jgi:hypothetical protein